MANAFDQFDAPVATAPAPNAFDSFDAPTAPPIDGNSMFGVHLKALPNNPLPTVSPDKWKNAYSGLVGLDQRLPDDQKPAFQMLASNTDNSSEVRAKAINRAFIKEHLPGWTDSQIDDNFQAVTDGFAKKVYGIDHANVAQTELYGAIHSHFNAEDSLKLEWEMAKDPVKRLDALRNYFISPGAGWDFYKKSVEQSFEKPKVLGQIPTMDNPDSANVVKQTAISAGNALGSAENFMQTAGGASVATNPAALLFATPYFAATTLEGAKKAFVDFANAISGNLTPEGKPVSAGTLSKDVIDTAMGVLATTAGGMHGAKGTGSAFEAVIDHAKLADTLRQEAVKTPLPQMKEAFNNAADHFQQVAETAEAAKENAKTEGGAEKPKNPAPVEFDSHETEEGFPEQWHATEDIPPFEGRPDGIPKDGNIGPQDLRLLEKAGYDVPETPPKPEAEIHDLENGSFVVTDKNTGNLIDYATTEAEAKRIADSHNAAINKPAEETLQEPDSGTGSAGTTFKTEKGSTYKVNDDGSTVRNKSEQGTGDTGKQAASKETAYVDPEGGSWLWSVYRDMAEAGKPARISIKDGKAILETPDGAGGWKREGKVEASASASPKVGLHPLELWDDGAHFGHKITEINKSEVAGNETAPAPASETTGIAHRVSEASGKAAPRGEGISAEDSVEHGRDLLKDGYDLSKGFEDFNKTKAVSADLVAAARARVEELAKKANAAADEHGTDSEQYRKASDAERKMIEMVKPVQTEWHRAGQAQQGETEIDTGTFHGLARAFRDSTGKDFTPEQATEATEHAKEVTKATEAEAKAKDKLLKAALGDEVRPPRSKRVLDYLSSNADAARERIKQRLENALGAHAIEGEDVGGLLSKENLEDIATVGADYIAKGATKLADWSEKMVKEFGESLKPHLDGLWDRSKEALDESKVETQLAAKKARLESSISELSKKIEAGDTSTKGLPNNRPAIEEVEKLTAKREALNAELAEMRKQEAKDNPPFDPEAKPTPEQTVAMHEEGEKWTPEQARALWELAKERYLDKGNTNLDDIRNGLATDLGLSVKDVAEGLVTPKGLRAITDEMYARAAEKRRVINQAKSWLQEAKTPGWLNQMKSVPGFFFNLATMGHQTVSGVTHMGIEMFDIPAAKDYWTAFGQQFKLMGWHDRGAYHERMMQDLVRDPLFIKAKRAGLANDPFKYQDDYQNALAVKFFKKIGLSGNRGFDALKLFRQARFNARWEALPDLLKTPEMAKEISTLGNHETGVVTNVHKFSIGNAPSWLLFAPKLEASRWAYLIGDPVRASKIISNWANETPEARQFAKSQIKQKAYIAGTYLGALAINQGLLSASGSDEEINFTDPRHGDWLSFKGGGHKIGVISPMIGSVRFLVNVMHDSLADRTKFQQMQGSRADQIATDTKDYLRGKLSPFAKIVTDSIVQSDFKGNTMPWSKDKIVEHDKKQGAHKMTFPEYAFKNLPPIPAQEFFTETWKKQGMNDAQIKDLVQAMIVAGFMGATGARVTEDTSKKKK